MNINKQEEYRVFFKIFTIAVLILGLLKLPYGYYSFVRVVVFSTCVIIFIEEFSNGLNKWHLIIGFFALLFNPFDPVNMGTKSLWVPIDIVVSVIIFYSIPRNSKVDIFAPDIFINGPKSYTVNAFTFERKFQENLREAFVDNQRFFKELVVYIQEEKNNIFVFLDGDKIGWINEKDYNPDSKFMKKYSILNTKIGCKAKISRTTGTLSFNGINNDGHIYHLNIDLPEHVDLRKSSKDSFEL